MEAVVRGRGGPIFFKNLLGQRMRIFIACCSTAISLVHVAVAAPTCEPGEYLKSADLCEKCTDGENFTPTRNRYSTCMPCNTTCGNYRKISPCNITHDIICGCAPNEIEDSDGCLTKDTSNDAICLQMLDHLLRDLHNESIRQGQILEKLLAGHLKAREEIMAAILNHSMQQDQTKEALLAGHLQSREEIMSAMLNHSIQNERIRNTLEKIVQYIVSLNTSKTLHGHEKNKNGVEDKVQQGKLNLSNESESSLLLTNVIVTLIFFIIFMSAIVVSYHLFKEKLRSLCSGFCLSGSARTNRTSRMESLGGSARTTDTFLEVPPAGTARAGNVRKSATSMEGSSEDSAETTTKFLEGSSADTAETAPKFLAASFSGSTRTAATFGEGSCAGTSPTAAMSAEATSAGAALTATSSLEAASAVQDSTDTQNSGAKIDSYQSNKDIAMSPGEKAKDRKKEKHRTSDLQHIILKNIQSGGGHSCSGEHVN